MQKKILFSYVFIFIALLIIMSISRSSSEKVRGETVSLVAPWWATVSRVKNFMSTNSTSESLLLAKDEEIHRLEVENQLLFNELSYFQSLSAYQHVLQLKDAVPARVLMRTFDTWNHSMWINVGSADNSGDLGEIIAKNSPVLVGQAVVGVIDLVEKHQSRVQLITDSRLNPSVRAIRGGEQDVLASEHIEAVLNWIKRKKGFSILGEEKEKLAKLLTEIKTSLQPLKKNVYLAKGELQGSTRPSGRGYHPFLKGVGFNYDFADEKGEGRDLRTGKPLSGHGEEVAILKVNDILVTTGMDGVFPEGLKVATVTKIELLKEGDYFYELEAQPIVNNLYGLDLVFVIPPQG